MELLSHVLSGEPGAVAALAAGDEAAWQALVEHLFEERPPAAPAPLVEAMLAIDPISRAWTERAKKGVAQARSEHFTTLSSAMKRVRPWLAAGVRAVRAPQDVSVLWIRLDEALSVADDDALVLARALVADAETVDAPAALRAEALLLLARRAQEEREIDEGLDATRRARAVDPTVALLAARREGALLLLARRVEEALSVLEPPMHSPGPLFGGGGTFRLGGTADDDPLEGALDEAATIAVWASATTPEWVRALGGLAERGALAWERFDGALAAMIGASSRVLSDLEVVARQAGERGFTRVARVAADELAARFPESLDAAGAAGPHLVAAGQHERASMFYERAAEAAPEHDPDKGRAFLWASEIACASGALDRAEALLARARPWVAATDALRVRVSEVELAAARERPGAADGGQAVDDGLALLAELASDPRALAETRDGHRLVDVLVRALLARGDRRALEVQQALLDAKRALWGECPALSLERHNLATVHAELGDHAEARAGLAQALRELEAALGDGHPHVELAKRSLARLPP